MAQKSFCLRVSRSAAFGVCRLLPEEAASCGDLCAGPGSGRTIFELEGRRTINSGKERGRAARECFEVQTAMVAEDMTEAIAVRRGSVCGRKVTGCGGGGCLVPISETPIAGAIKVLPCRPNN